MVNDSLRHPRRHGETSPERRIAWSYLLLADKQVPQVAEHGTASLGSYSRKNMPTTQQCSTYISLPSHEAIPALYRSPGQFLFLVPQEKFLRRQYHCSSLHEESRRDIS